MKRILCSLFLCAPFTFWCQSKKDTLSLYYEINVAQSSDNDRRVDSLCTSFKGKVVNVWVYGYADFLHTDLYNSALSKRRAEHVKERLSKNLGEPQMTILACDGKGEKASEGNGNRRGQARQRRVDVIYEFRPQNRVVDTRPVKPEKIEKKGEVQKEPEPIDVAEL